MSGFDLEADRAHLTHMLGVFMSVDPSSGDEHVRTVKWMLGVAAADQFFAACKETEQVFQTVVKRQGKPDLWVPNDSNMTGLSEVAGDTRKLLVSMLAAGAIRCWDAHHCEHQSDRPMIALLGSRILSCDDCVMLFEHVMLEHDLLVREHQDMICDLCLEESVYFHPLIATLGNIRMSGDMCSACMGKFGENARRLDSLSSR